MDARNPSATPTFASCTPLHIGAVGLKVRDLERVAGFYNHALGLALLRSGRDSVELGAGGVPLVRLEQERSATPDDPREAGLYHTAFLMPTRGDLARWILHVARNKVALTGASDHAVSEAFYLDDPEGNGVEVYSDRPAEGWQWTGDDLRITTDPLDVDDILREVPATAEYPGAPGGLRIGHVHLRVGDVMRAEGFYRGVVGLDVTRRRHGACADQYPRPGLIQRHDRRRPPSRPRHYVDGGFRSGRRGFSRQDDPQRAARDRRQRLPGRRRLRRTVHRQHDVDGDRVPGH